MSKFLVDTNLPNAGLGNMLLVWARAMAFAEINSLPMVEPIWNRLHIGPWLRNEKCKRYYGGIFSSKNYQSRLKFAITNIRAKSVVYSNPKITKFDLDDFDFAGPSKIVFLFDKFPPWTDYFQDLKEYRDLIKEKLYGDIRPQLLEKILQNPAPKIGIHIRRGDYYAPQADDDFTIRRHAYTPLDWYIGVLGEVRKSVGENIPATIFSDGYPEELREILALPNVAISPETSAISDMITMSRSQLLIGSCHSSFSAWASYLGQCPTIWQSNRSHLYQPIFTKKVRKTVYEGGLDPFTSNPIPALLSQNLDELLN